MSTYAFGPYHLDVEGLLLLHDGEPVALGPKVVETLLALIEHPGEVLAKSALLDRIWPEGFVEEANLAQNIYVLRKTLRAHWDVDAIETVPRRGYRFTAAVARVERAVPAPSEAPAKRSRIGLIASFAALAAAIVIGFGMTAHGANRGTPELSEKGSRLYQIGHYYWNLRSRDGVEKSLQYFAQVIDSDPSNARGYAGLAEANAMIGDYHYGKQSPKVYFARARAYAERALALDPNCAEAEAALGLIALEVNDVPRATTLLERALALDPSSGAAREWYGVALIKQGRLHDAFVQLQKAGEFDPLSVATSAWLGSAAYLDRRYADAIAYSTQALELAPQRTEVLTTLGEAYEAQGRYTEAIAAYRRYGANAANRAEAAVLLAHVYAKTNRMREAREQLVYARAHAKDIDDTDLAAAIAAVGDKNVAIDVLRRVHDRSLWIAIENDPRFDVLHSEAAWQKLSQESA